MAEDICVSDLCLRIEPNSDHERLTCFVCSRGESPNEHGPPEWLVHMRSPSMRIVTGLHEKCRAKSEVRWGEDLGWRWRRF